MTATRTRESPPLAVADRRRRRQPLLAARWRTAPDASSRRLALGVAESCLRRGGSRRRAHEQRPRDGGIEPTAVVGRGWGPARPGDVACHPGASTSSRRASGPRACRHSPCFLPRCVFDAVERGAFAEHVLEEVDEVGALERALLAVGRPGERLRARGRQALRQSSRLGRRRR